MKISELLNSFRQSVNYASFPRRNLRVDVEILLCRILDCRRVDLYLEREKEVSVDAAEKFYNFLEKRTQGVPVQYLIKETEFFGMKFFIEEGVFIPRPETEVLVERLLDVLSRSSFGKPVDILELCTGSGNIAVSLTKNCPDCKIVATDINQKALSLAEKNARWHKLSDRIDFLKGDLFEALGKGEYSSKKFNVIVANPPYIARHKLKELPREVSYEPQAALEAGSDGLEFYRKIIPQALYYLKAGGLLFLETSGNNRKQIADIFKKSRAFAPVLFFADLNNIYRFVIAKRQ
ncbi:MAG: peptide chain release factor N(5)-glutamine methyltransferase [Candidatus Omnitrophica bacterium]|nr:peptide chain release factor N(5)-glutamine methyltransferase [Candidatus Omnitrophota bacterium]